MDLRLTVKGTIHEVFPEGNYPRFVLKFMDGQYEKFLLVTLNKKIAEQINNFEPGGEAEVVITPSSSESKTKQGAWNNTNWCNKINFVNANPF